MDYQNFIIKHFIGNIFKKWKITIIMKYAHLIRLSVFSKEGEKEEDILRSLKELIPFNLEDEKIIIEIKKASGFEEKKIIIFTVTLKKETHTTKFLKNLNQKLSDDQKSLLKRQSESRLDKKYNFFIRLDKQKLLEKNETWITDSGDCFHIRISIAAFPKNRENALNAVINLFN